MIMIKFPKIFLLGAVAVLAAPIATAPKALPRPRLKKPQPV